MKTCIDGYKHWNIENVQDRGKYEYGDIPNTRQDQFPGKAAKSAIHLATNCIHIVRLFVSMINSNTARLVERTRNLWLVVQTW